VKYESNFGKKIREKGTIIGTKIKVFLDLLYVCSKMMEKKKKEAKTLFLLPLHTLCFLSVKP
jgi:hypothetical protein